MSFTFFTLGGQQFWEDVLFFQKWRIQKNCFTKKYRLLDNWDIRRASGSFDNCLRILNRYIDVFQIKPLTSKAVIMIHGLLGNKNNFKKMSQAFESSKFLPIAINYPSTRKNINEHVNQLNTFLNNLSYVTEISFVTQGVGGIILRKLLNKKDIWQKNIHIKRIVQINPPNRGRTFWEKLANHKIFAFIFGPILDEVSPNKIKNIPAFPDKTDFAIIISHNRIVTFIADLLPKSLQYLFHHSKDSYMMGMKDFTETISWNINPLNDQKNIQACLNFILSGSLTTNIKKIKKL